MGNLTQCCEDQSSRVPPRLASPPTPPREDHIVPCKQIRKMTYEDFEPVEYLGEGKFGRVVNVKKKDSGEQYAMKLISKKKLSEFGLVQNTLLEKQILKSFSHPFLVRLNYSFQNTYHVYLVMEFVQGGDLYYYLQKQKFFPEDTCRVLMAEVVEAISFLHANGVMYRDLKPQNVLLAKDGHIKISDFGLSKLEGGTPSYTIAGTTDYFAPEMLSEKGYNHLIDLWALGVFLFQVSHGYPPFNRPGTDIKLNIANCEYQIKETLSPECKDLIDKLLQIQPRRRIGAESFDQIRQHAWFRGLDWSALMGKNISSPLKQSYQKYGKVKEVKQQSKRLAINSAEMQPANFDIQNFTYNPNRI